jgi:uncharacterized repeat protein (TIGR04138 family)
MSAEPARSMEDVIRRDGRYPVEAYGFLHEGLELAVKQAHGKEAVQARRHVTGQQLCLALRDLAIQRWGLLAQKVLQKWNIHATDDFGNMVYLLIRNDLMKKTDEDSVGDFHSVFDFNEAFGHNDAFELKE